MKLDCWQINLQEHFGGGEVYTQFLSQALVELGCKVHLLVSRKASFWGQLTLPGVEISQVGDVAEALAALPDTKSWVISHGGLPSEEVREIRLRHVLTGIAHMPLFGRNPHAFDGYHLVIAVSNYVLGSLKAISGIHWYDEPLYGVASLDRGHWDGGHDAPLLATPPYDWDLRKVRDRLLAKLYPAYARLLPVRSFTRRPGLTLGIVSRLTPIKQFPEMFRLLAPHLAANSEINLEIFGSGGYASVRDLRRALAPMGDRVRFWGRQQDVVRVYSELDYLLTGLPEKEALGLNVIEAQVCGLPVLAVAAPPFTETVEDGRTGFLFTDPRQDGGEHFAALLKKVLIPGEKLNPKQAVEHLARFSFPVFRERVAHLLPRIEQEFAS